MLDDLRHALRSFARVPAFAALATGILATGIGAATLMFTLVHTALLQALPFDDPDRIVWMYNLRTERDRAPLSIPDLEDYRRESTTVSGLAAFVNWTTNLTGAGPAERLEGTRVSGNFFQLLGLRPFLGRPLQLDDETREARVTVLTHRLWMRRFAGDPSIIGQGVVLSGLTFTVVGVLPPSFMFPFREAELAVPLSLVSDVRRSDRGANFLRVLARLGPGVTLQQANADLNRIAERLQRQYPTENARKTGVSLYPLHAEIVRDYRVILWTLFGAVAILLAVACGNLANLQLLRNAGRQSELSLRLSLGASRSRLLRLLLTETLILAGAGTAIGLGLACAGLRLWMTVGPTSFPRLTDLALSRDVFIFALLLACLTAIACGLVPAWSVSRDLTEGLRDSTRSATALRKGLRRSFVALQMAAAAVLLVMMGIGARGFWRLEQVSPGFTPDRALSIQLSLIPSAYSSRETLVRFGDALKDRLASIPEVQSAGLVSLLPLSGLLSTVDIAFPDRPAPPPDEVPQAHFRIASDGYFAAAGVTVLAGRAFANFDRSDSRPVAIVSRTFSDRHWPGQSAIGKAVRLTEPGAPLVDIVGVVSDVKHFTLDAPPTADLYVPLTQMPRSQTALLASRMFWVVRSRSTSPELGAAVREAVRSIDPGIASSGERTLATVMADALGPRRINVTLLESFGVLAATLCALGVYAVAGFSARSRQRELGIRTALGAQRRDLVALMLGSELRPIAVGIAVGLVAAFGVAPSLFASAFEVDPRDTSLYVGVGAGLLLMTACAGYAPVRRAVRTNPAHTFRIQ